MDKEIKLFEDYINKFDRNNPKINHKYKHTYRVVSNAKEIAKSLKLDEKETTRACVSSLFHDIGRFSQIDEYHTFDDGKSFDHGDIGYVLLKEMGYNDEIVLQAVKYHNKKNLPKFDDLTDMHCKLVRDSDKLDIMGIQFDKPVASNNEVSSEILDCFKKHMLLDNNMGDTNIIYILRNLAFIFDINYKRTIELIIERNLINFKINLLKEVVDKDIVEFIEKEIKKYIKERFDIIC